MIRLFRAEWRKASGHRWLAGFLIWVFPVGATAFFLIVILAALFAENAGDMLDLQNARWTDAAGVWNTLSDFPGNVVGRMPILAFVAALFAGEFEWGTWKNITPRNSRAALILIKFLTLGVFVVTSFAAMSLIVGVGTGIATAIVGYPYGPEPTTTVIAEFASHYALRASLAFASTLIVAAFAALAALFTRRIVGGIMVGFLISIIEPNTLLLFMWLSRLLDNLDLIKLYRFTPSFNIGNINAWIQFDRPLDLGLPAFPLDTSLYFSIAVVGVWIIALIALVTLLFQRQDITS